VLVGAVGLATLIAFRFGLVGGSAAARVTHLTARAREHAWVVPAFVAAYALITSLGVPGFAFTLAGGAIFGLA
jgi:uncharacterized membrane protein YdjX (TVP38/TMEM64 family)